MLTRRLFATLGLGAGLMGLFGLAGCGAKVAYEGSRIRSVTYSSGGGMTGGGVSSELRRQKDGTVTLSTRSRMWHNTRETGMDYIVDESAFDRFAEIANEYDLLKVSKRKESPLIALDAPTSSISYTVLDEDGTYDLDASFRISSTQDLSDRDWDGFNAVTVALAELASQSEGVPYEEPMTLTIVANGYQISFTLNDSSASRDLAERCPLDIELENYADNEKIFYLDEPLDTSDTPLAIGAKGTLCYFEPWNDVVFFYEEGAPYEGLYELGCIDDEYSIGFMGDLEPGSANLWSNIPVE